jgi:hypothetical protein
MTSRSSTLYDLMSEWFRNQLVAAENLLVQSEAMVKVERSDYTVGQLKYAEANRSAVKRMYSQLPAVWRRVAVDTTMIEASRIVGVAKRKQAASEAANRRAIGRVNRFCERISLISREIRESRA